MNKILPQILFYFLIFPLLHGQISITNLDCGIILQETTVDKIDNFYANDYKDCYSGSSSYKGSDQAFVIQKPYDRGRLSISLFSEGEDDLDIFLFDTSFTNCIAASTNPVVGNRNIEAIFDADPPLPAGTYYVVVDGNTNQSDKFRISAACGPLDQTSATKIECGKPLKDESTNFSRNNVNAFRSNDVLRGGNTGPENLYYFDLFFQEEVTISLDNFASTDNFELVLLQDSDEYTGIAASTNLPGKSEQIKMDLTPGRYFILVDGYDGTAGTYDLAVNWNCREDQETGPIPIQCGEIQSGSTVGFTDDFAFGDYSNCVVGFLPHNFEYNDALYRFDLEKAQSVQIELDILTEHLDLNIFLLESSNLAGQPNNPQPGACITLGYNSSGKERSIFENLKAGTYWIGIDGGLIGGGFGPLPPNEGLFTLTLNCLDLPSPCDLKGEFIDNGTAISGFGRAGLLPIYFIGIGCVEDTYSLKNKLYGNVYTYYSEQADLTAIKIESENLDVNAFVFSCEVDNRAQLCVGQTNSVKRTTSFVAKANSYYQIVVLSHNPSQNHSLSITSPEGPCSNDVPEVLGLNQFIEGDLVGFGDDFNSDKSSFFQNCSSADFTYEGEDRLFQLNIISGLGVQDENMGQGTFGTVTLEAEAAMGLFLFNYQCGEKNCIAQIELPEGGGIDSLPLNNYINREGTYYLLLDKADNKGSSNFKLSRWFENLFVACFADTAEFHTISFTNGLLLQQDIIDDGDLLYIDYKDRQYVGETLYDPYTVLEVENESFSIPSVELLNQIAEPYNPADTVNYQKCGFENGEEFEFKVLKKDGRVLVLDPVFDDSPIFANPPTTFNLGATTLVTGIRLKEVERSVKIDFEPGNVNMNALPFTNTSFEGHIDVNSSWEILGLAAHPWIKIFDATAALQNQAVTQGQGPKKVLVKVDDNPDAETRQGAFEIVAQNGFARRVLITQVANSCATPAITESVTDVSCKGEMNGAILLNTENIQALTFNWEDGAIGSTRNNLQAGTYQVTVSGQGDCESVLNYEIGEPDLLTISIDTIRDEIGDALGSIDVNVDGGTPPYSYFWSWQTGFLLTNQPSSGDLPSGVYQVRVEDANACIAIIDNVVIDEIVSAHDFHLLSNKLIISPNPGQGIFHLDWQQPLEEMTAARLINVVGSNIKSFSIPKFTKKQVLDLTDQPAGIYFLILATSEGRVARKIVIE